MCSSYKHAIEDTFAALHIPAHLRQESRWLNGISYTIAINGLDQAIQALEALPFVTELEVVGRMIRSENLVDITSSDKEVQSVLHEAAQTDSNTRDRKHATGTSIDLDYGDSQSQLERIGVPALHKLGYTGQGVIISVLDSGFNQRHESLAGLTVIGAYDFVYNDTNVEDEPGENSASHHGTATWSNIGAKKSGKLYGGSYDASYILCKTEDIRSETSIEEDNFVRAIEYSENLGADILSASLGYDRWLVWGDLDGHHSLIARVGNRAVDLGLLMVVANGNAGSKGIGTPADMDRVLSLGALDRDNRVASFSSRGPTFDGRIKPDVSAPGVAVKVALFSSTDRYERLSGTSFATPLTAGVAGQLLQAHPTWTNMQIRDAIVNTARRDSTTVPNNEYGWGIVDALAAHQYTHPNLAALCTAPYGTWNTTTSKCICNAGYYNSDCRTQKLKCLDWCSSLCTYSGDCLCMTQQQGRCTLDSIVLSTPWTCDRKQYSDGAFCDCQCGLFDPDCDDESLPVRGCSGNASWRCARFGNQGRCTEDRSSPSPSFPSPPETEQPPTQTPAPKMRKSTVAYGALSSILLVLLSFIVR